MKVLLLAGGESNERDVSLASSKAIFEALKHLRHEVIGIDPASGHTLLDNHGNFLEFKKSVDVPAATKIDSVALTRALQAPDVSDVDVVFIGLHGGTGENGSLQNLLELAGMKYTGSGMNASALAMNKAAAKRLMMSENVLTPPFKLYRRRNWQDYQSIAADIRSNFEFPIIVKPNDGGSTVGLTKVKESDDLLTALERADEQSPEILVEQFIPGREMTVSVLDGEPLPVVEIKPKNELYDYEAKYTKGKSEYIAPAKIDELVAHNLQLTAARVYDIIGAEGLARVDFILTPSGEAYCLELNTLPGMTNLSLAPMAAKCVGIDFDGLVERIIRSALKR